MQLSAARTGRPSWAGVSLGLYHSRIATHPSKQRAADGTRCRTFARVTRDGTDDGPLGRTTDQILSSGGSFPRLLGHCPEQGAAHSKGTRDFESRLYAVPITLIFLQQGNFAFSEYLDGWVTIHRQKGTFQRAYDHWILSEGAQPTHSRWSVVRNVLHWID